MTSKPADRHDVSSTIAGVAGNVMEWYDFALFGYFAPIIARNFFPAGNELSALIQTYGVFAVGFVMRPLGAVLFGFVGDRFGRSTALILSVIMMGAPTFLLGLLPNYASIGIWAPILLIGVRLVQGLSVGGEFSCSVTYLVETAPANRRGLAGSWANVGGLAGTLLGAGTAASLSSLIPHAALEAWGWRVPFVFGIVLAACALYLRRNLPNTSIFQSHAQAHKQDNPLHEALGRDKRQTILAILFASGYGVFFYIPLIYLPTFASTEIGISDALALRINTLAIAAMLPLIPLAGLVSDRWLRRKHILMAAFAAMAIAAWPVFHRLIGGGELALLGGQLTFAALIAIPVGAAPAMFAEMFPTEDRLTGYSIAFNVGLGLVGGTAPMIATWLISVTHAPIAPAIYLAALSSLSFVALALMKDRSREPLR